MIEKVFLESVQKKFSDYKILAEKAIDQLEDDQLFVQANNDSNSIAMIVRHMSGNMLSRWTDFLSTDGEKEWRKRDDEFEVVLKTKEEVMASWEAGWDCLYNTLRNLTPDLLLHTIYIRGEAHTVLEAINRQLAHYPYHVGQIVFYAKMLKQKEWNSLSIPKRK